MAADFDRCFLTVRPIGYMRSVFLYKNGTPRQPSLCSSARGSLTILKTIFNNPEHSLEGLEEFSHAWIIFLFHQNKNAHTKAKVRPPRLNGKRVGVFSTRSPYRPNAIGLTLAKIDRISGSSIYFTGIDLIDGTPVLDIKPYIPLYDVPSNTRGTYASQSSAMNDGESDQSVDMLVPSILNLNTERSQGKAISVCSCSSFPSNSTTEVECGTTCLEPDACDKCIWKESCCIDTCTPHMLGPGEMTESFPLTDTAVSQQNDPPASGVEAVKEKLCCETRVESQVSELTREQGFFSANHESDSCQNLDSALCLKHVSFVSEIPHTFSEEYTPPLTNDCMLSYGEPKVVFSNVNSRTLSRGTKACELVPYSPENQQLGLRDTTHATRTSVANWLASPPVSKLRVSFTNRAVEDLEKFNHQRSQGSDTDYKLDFLSEQSEIKSAIVSVLLEDPRSVYRRQKCQDKLYFFTVDQIHVTCWFDGDCAEVLKLQPISHAEKLTERQL